MRAGGDSISQLLYRMCEENAIDRLMALNFAGLADEVEDTLAFNVRNMEPASGRSIRGFSTREVSPFLQRLQRRSW